MAKSNVKPSFFNILKFFKRIDTILGLFLLKDSSWKKTTLERFFSLTLKRHVLFSTFLFISTLIVSNFNLISVIFCACFLSFELTWFVAMKTMISKKATFYYILAWCEDMYNYETKFCTKIQEIASAQLASTERKTMKVIKWFAILLYVENVAYTIGVAIIGFFLPERMYAKYQTPIPFYLPFNNQNTLLAYSSTVFVGFMVCIDGAAMTIYTATSFFCITFHILGYLDIIVIAAKQMKTEMWSNYKFFVVEEGKEGDEGRTTFEEWIKILTDMISDVSAMVTITNGFYGLIMLFVEFATFGVLFLSGLIFINVRQHYVFAIGLPAVALIFFLLCYINEMILDKFEDINKIFYSTPWYGLRPKQRKILLIAMNCNQLQKGITAATIHHLTMKRFAIIIKAGYTNLLVLKDLIQK